MIELYGAGTIWQKNQLLVAVDYKSYIVVVLNNALRQLKRIPANTIVPICTDKPGVKK
jgi:hypothetical protein